MTMSGNKEKCFKQHVLLINRKGSAFVTIMHNYVMYT